MNDLFQNVFNTYLQKSLLNPNYSYFLANGKQINSELTVERQMSDQNKQNKKMNVLVLLNEEGATQVQVMVKSKDIICPTCKEPCLISTENFKIKLFGCMNNHTKENINIKDFPDTQNINISNIICDKCKIKNKTDSVNNEFYQCLTCNYNICSLCKSVHQQDHYIINYEQKNYICNIHNEPFIKYCTECNKNICFICVDENEHEEHNKISLNQIKPNIDEANNNLKEMKKEIDIFNNVIKDIIKKLNELVNIMNIYYEINSNIINYYENKKRNYQILQNIKQINNNNAIYYSINNINKMTNIKDKLYNAIDLYNNINSEQEIKFELFKEKEILNNNINLPSDKKLNEMTMIYNINKNKNKIDIICSSFVSNNKNNCYLLIDGKKYELCQSIILNIEQKKRNTLEIKLIETKAITNMSCMFFNINALISLPDISEWDTKNVTNMKWMFSSCNSLKLLSDISKWDTKNVTEMSFMFCDCSSLVSLPDISNWNVSNVTDMNSMFKNCRTLISFPDISKWNTSKVNDMKYMFSGCKSLKSFPDISKWIVNKKMNKITMFEGCDKNIINDTTAVEKIMLEAALKAKVTIVEKCFHKFSPYGVSGVVVIAESHFAIHTWPEYNFAAVDFFTCNQNCNTDIALKYLHKAFNSDQYSTTTVCRGVLK